MRRVLRGAQLILIAIPVAAGVSVVSGASPIFLIGFAVAEALVFTGARGLERSLDAVRGKHDDHR